jgi:hypothetical protein
MTIPYKIVTLLLLFLVIEACVTSKALLRGRIEKYYADLNPRTMWELSSEDFRKRITKKEYLESFEEHNYLKEFKDVGFSIEEVSIAGNQAKVKMRIQAKALTGNTKIDEILYDRWIFEYSNWYMHDPGRTE